MTCGRSSLNQRRSGERGARLGAVVLTVVGLLVAAVAPVAPQIPARPPIDELVADLQTRWDLVVDLSGEFEQSYTGGVLRTSLTERGTVSIKKPGRMRWSYTLPEEKLFVSDGETLYSYFPLDRQVLVTRMPPDDRATTPALFLAGKGDLARDYTAAYDESAEAPPNTLVVRLTPVLTEAEYEWLTLAVDRTSLQIRRLVAIDYQGGISTFTFSNLKENQGLSDKLFAFEIPGNTDVITDDNLVR